MRGPELPGEVMHELLRGQALLQAGDAAAAVALLSDVAACAGAPVEAHLLLAQALRQLGQLDRALAAYDAAVARDADRVEAHNGRGLALQALGRPDEAASAFERAVALAPERATARYNLAMALRQRGEGRRAVAELRALLEHQPDDEQARVALAAELRGQGEAEQAVELLAGASASPAVLHERGAALAAVGRSAEAIAALQRAVACADCAPAACYDLGLLLGREARLGASEAALRRYLALAPEDAAGHQALGSTLKAQGRMDEAVGCYREALRREPKRAGVHSDLLLALHYCAEQGDAEVAEEHRRWAAAHAPPLPPRPSRPPLAGRRMRIGYLSADLRDHSVARFVEPLLEAHDRAGVGLYAYNAVRRPDAVTERLQSYVEHWRPVAGLDDEALAAAIAADGIDVLVELGGHTGGTRLGAVARRPAPLQVSYLGYPDTTGLEAVDLRLTDARADPPGAPWHGTERLLRIAGGMLCYRPSDAAPPIVAPPSRRGQPLTFGCAGAMPKLSPALQTLWARLLERCPDARLLLHNPSLGDEATAARLRDRFDAHGIDPARLILRGFAPSEREHLATYQDIDVALDTFPYAGTTTTCEALWMGLPVVTLAGDRHAGRMGASLLGQVGLGELVARTFRHYLDIAAALIADGARLLALRQSMRERLQASPLCDARRLAGAIEDAFRQALQST